MSFGNALLSMIVKMITPFAFLLSEIIMYYKGSKTILNKISAIKINYFWEILQ